MPFLISYGLYLFAFRSFKLSQFLIEFQSRASGYHSADKDRRPASGPGRAYSIILKLGFATFSQETLSPGIIITYLHPIEFHYEFGKISPV